MKIKKKSKRDVQVGVGVAVMKGNAVLLGKRKGAHASGFWSFPGGHLEFGETVLECAQREVYEETGLKVVDLKVNAWSEEFFEKEQKQYLTIIATARYKDGEVQLCEPESFEKWEWVAWKDLKDYNLAIFTKNAVERINKKSALY